MRVKIDEDLPADIAEMLRTAGHDALTVVQQNVSGSSDHDLWQLVQAESRVLFTADKGLADVRTHPPGTHGGIVLFRLPRESRAGYVRLAETFLARFRLEEVAGAVIVVSPASIRIHRQNDTS